VFENGERREFDTTPYLEKGIFKRLKDESYFQTVRLSLGTVCWPEGQDFCPDRRSREGQWSIVKFLLNDGLTRLRYFGEACRTAKYRKRVSKYEIF